MSAEEDTMFDDDIKEHRWVNDEEFSHGGEQGQACDCGMTRRVLKSESDL